MGEEVDKVDSFAQKSKPLTPKQRLAKQKKFLKAYGETGIIKAACHAARISRQTFYNWRDNDTEFAAQLPDTVEDAHDTLEYAAYAQAVLGVESYVVNQGRIVREEIPQLDSNGNPMLDEKGHPIVTYGKPLTERKYAPGLLQTLLKANLPKKYKDKVEHTGQDGGPVQVHVFLPD